jgi:HD-GYP domain-containing protein (c-di-GMP phosphodiesterase class II)
MLANGKRRFAETTAAHCEAATRIADRLGMSGGVRRGLGEMHERWDGAGMPAGLSGSALSKPRRVVHVAHDAVVFAGTGGVAAALHTMKERRGGAYDPDVVEALLGNAQLLDENEDDAWSRALDAEPGTPVVVPHSRLDGIAEACADFADLKVPFLAGHSSRVARLAAAGAELMGWDAEDVVIVRRAAHLHNLGRVGVANGIWERPGALGVSDMERVRLHPYHTERILARSPALAPYAVVAGSHHENVDGSGYHRRVAGAQLSRHARLLRAADACEAMGRDRPHRPALTRDQRARALAAEVEAGRLDPAMTRAVVEAAGERLRVRTEWPAGLTEREVEVLRLLIQGETNRRMADRLHISQKTVGHHVEHIYNKIGVCSRAGAALFAMENDLAD